MFTQPKSKFVQAIDDMGEFRAEYPGNFTYKLQVFSARFCWLCSVGMLAIMIGGLLHWPRVAAEKPDEVPWYLWYAIAIGWCFVAFYVCMIIYAVFHNRRQTLLFALFERGLVVVRRNGSMEKIFWNEIDEVERHDARVFFAKEKTEFRGITVITKPFDPHDPYSKSGVLSIPVPFFQNAEELCRRLLAETKN